jgi:hypothetical protein
MVKSLINLELKVLLQRLFDADQSQSKKNTPNECS